MWKGIISLRVPPQGAAVSRGIFIDHFQINHSIKTDYSPLDCSRISNTVPWQSFRIGSPIHVAHSFKRNISNLTLDWHQQSHLSNQFPCPNFETVRNRLTISFSRFGAKTAVSFDTDVSLPPKPEIYKSLFPIPRKRLLLLRSCFVFFGGERTGLAGAIKPRSLDSAELAKTHVWPLLLDRWRRREQ